jgi:hypothetical protein
MKKELFTLSFSPDISGRYLFATALPQRINLLEQPLRDRWRYVQMSDRRRLRINTIPKIIEYFQKNGTEPFSAKEIEIYKEKEVHNERLGEYTIESLLRSAKLPIKEFRRRIREPWVEPPKKTWNTYFG